MAKLIVAAAGAAVVAEADAAKRFRSATKKGRGIHGVPRPTELSAFLQAISRI